MPRERVVGFVSSSVKAQIEARARAERMSVSAFVSRALEESVNQDAANAMIKRLMPEIKAAIGHSVNSAFFGFRKLLVFSGLQAHVGTTMASHILAALDVPEEESNGIRREAERVAGKHLRETNRELERLLSGFEDEEDEA